MTYQMRSTSSLSSPISDGRDGLLQMIFLRDICVKGFGKKGDTEQSKSSNGIRKGERKRKLDTREFKISVVEIEKECDQKFKFLTVQFFSNMFVVLLKCI